MAPPDLVVLTPATWVGPAVPVGAPRTAAVTIVATGGLGSQVKVTLTGPRVTSTLVAAIRKATSPPTVVNAMSGTANVVVAGWAVPPGAAMGPIDIRTPSTVLVPSRVLEAETVTLATPATVSPGRSKPSPIPVCRTEAGTVTFHDWFVSEAVPPLVTGLTVRPVASKISSLMSGVALLRQLLAYDAVPVTSVGTAFVPAVVDVGLDVAVVDGATDVDVDDDEVDEDDVELDELDEELDVDDEPDDPLLANGCAGTGVVPVHAGAGAGPQPEGDGVPGVQEKVTVMMPPGPTDALVELVPSDSATFEPVAVQVEVGMFAVTDNGVAVSSPDVLLAGVGSVIVVVPLMSMGPSV